MRHAPTDGHLASNQRAGGSNPPGCATQTTGGRQAETPKTTEEPGAHGPCSLCHDVEGATSCPHCACELWGIDEVPDGAQAAVQHMWRWTEQAELTMAAILGTVWWDRHFGESVPVSGHDDPKWVQVDGGELCELVMDRPVGDGRGVRVRVEVRVCDDWGGESLVSVDAIGIWEPKKYSALDNPIALDEVGVCEQALGDSLAEARLYERRTGAVEGRRNLELLQMRGLA